MDLHIGKHKGWKRTSYKTKIMKHIVWVLLLLAACNTDNSKNKQAKKGPEGPMLQKQDRGSFPEIGKPMLDFTLKDIQNYDKHEASLEDFKGKWLLLDFWTRYCTNCLRSFPKVDKLKDEFQDDVVFMLVGRNDGRYYHGTEKVYEKVRQRYHLDLPFVYQPNLFDTFGVSSVPHIIWIDPNGIVRAITSSTDLNAENIEQFLEGKTPYFFKVSNKEEKQREKTVYDYRKPLLINGNGGDATDFLYRSVLTGINRKVYGGVYPSFFPPLNDNMVGFSAVNITLKNLYYAAYGDTIRPNPDIIERPNNYGKWWCRPLLEVKDSTLFQLDTETGRGITLGTRSRWKPESCLTGKC